MSQLPSALDACCGPRMMWFNKADGRALFVNIQHPGEDMRNADIGNPTRYPSHWPDGGMARPRSATVVITRDDGGVIGI